jgi:hypothetical protein
LIPLISKVFFLRGKSLSWAAFEKGSRLSRPEERGFSQSGLTSIHLPASVTLIGEFCFYRCDSLTSITFDPALQLQKIRRKAFDGVPVEALILPDGFRHLQKRGWKGCVFPHCRRISLFVIRFFKTFQGDV